MVAFFAILAVIGLFGVSFDARAFGPIARYGYRIERQPTPRWWDRAVQVFWCLLCVGIVGLGVCSAA